MQPKELNQVINKCATCTKPHDATCYGWLGWEIFLHATKCTSMVSYIFLNPFKSHKWPKWISSQHYPYIIKTQNFGQRENQHKRVFCRMPNANAEWLLKFIDWLGLGNWVNQVSGQFSQDNDYKWNLIHSVS